MSQLPDGDVGVGELIGQRCISADGVDLGRIVYVERDGSGAPAWIDVAFSDAVHDRGVSTERVRMSAGLVADRTGESVDLSLAFDELRSRWVPSSPVTVEEPSL